MKNVKLSIVYFMILIVLASCQTNGSFSRPDFPLCIGLSDSSLSCALGDDDYTASPENHLCTTADGYEAYELYVDCLEKELLKCYKSPKRCKPSSELCNWKPKKLSQHVTNQNQPN
jgi:hypothetical protein